MVADSGKKPGLFSTIFGCFSTAKQSDEGTTSSMKGKDVGGGEGLDKGKNGLFGSK